MLITLLALALAAHGIAHLVGFAAAFQLLPADKLPAMPLGKVQGVLWLLAALAFLGTAIVVRLRYPFWPQLTVAVCLASLVLCVTAWPEARIGATVDVLLIALVLFAVRAWTHLVP